MDVSRHESSELKARLKDSPVVAILGPRQCGKTTLARQCKPSHYFDMERPADLAALENPIQALHGLKGLVAIDEIQRRPDLFPVLRVLVDENPKVRFLILSSASRDLIQQSSETLAGRISYLRLGGFQTQGLPGRLKAKLWQRGRFPRSVFARNEAASLLWRQDYISTFLERDIPQLGINLPAATLRRFWTMVAHYHGQLVNYSELGKSFGVTDMTVRKYLEILEGTFMVKALQP